MKRASLALVLAAGFAVPLAVGAAAPKWTAQGALTKLNMHTIVVHGHSCHLVGSYGRFVSLRYDVGDWLKILCKRGVLEHVGVLPKPSVIVTTSAARTAPTSGPSGPTFSVSGTDILITAVDASTITVNTPIGGTSYVCTIVVGSPSVAGLKAGDRLRDVGCANGTLTELTRLPG